MDCGTCAWASDNWRETSVFNYNNKCLLDLSLLYNWLAQFIRGTPIQNYFFALFEPLQTDVAWLSENPTLAARYAVLRHSGVPRIRLTGFARDQGDMVLFVASDIVRVEFRSRAESTTSPMFEILLRVPSQRSVGDRNSRFFVQLTNAFLGFFRSYRLLT